MKQHETEQVELPVDSVAERSGTDVVAAAPASVDDGLLDALDAAVASEAGDPADSDDGDTGGASDEAKPRRRLALGRAATIGLGLVVVGGVAVVAAVVAGSMGGSPATLPAVVTSPSQVLDVLESSGIDCSSAAVAGEVGSCSSTITVRVFPSDAQAQSWVKEVLKGANSSIGWAVRGNVVIAAPLERTPTMAQILGDGSRTF